MSVAAHRVSVVANNQAEAILHTLVQAFADDPFQQWLYPDQARRPGCIARSFRIVLASNLGRRTVWTTQDQQSVAVWVPPGQSPIGGRAVLSHLPSLTYLARATGRRVGEVVRGLREIEQRKPKAPHWYLVLVGTLPAAQGAGRATAVLEPMLARCDQDRTPAYLESSHDRNVPYYERLGFSVTEQLTLPNGPPIWCMWRSAPPA
jgi:GNAT superfamily N-acetyltransferase